MTHTLHLKNEVSRNSSMIQSLTLQRDWILDKKPQMLDILNLIQALSDVRDADERKSIRTIGTTAVATSIDNAWANACASSPSIKQWWESDRPRRLPRGCLGRFHVVSRLFPFARESFRAFSRSPTVVSRLVPFAPGRFAPIPVRPCLCLSHS